MVGRTLTDLLGGQTQAVIVPGYTAQHLGRDGNHHLWISCSCRLLWLNSDLHPPVGWGVRLLPFQSKSGVFVCVSMSLCIHMGVSGCVATYVPLYLCACPYLSTCVCLHIFVCVSVNISMYVCLCTSMFSRDYLYIRVSTCVCLHICLCVSVLEPNT